MSPCTPRYPFVQRYESMFGHTNLKCTDTRTLTHSHTHLNTLFPLTDSHTQSLHLLPFTYTESSPHTNSYTHDSTALDTDPQTNLHLRTQTLTLSHTRPVTLHTGCSHSSTHPPSTRRNGQDGTGRPRQREGGTSPVVGLRARVTRPVTGGRPTRLTTPPATSRRRSDTRKRRTT